MKYAELLNDLISSVLIPLWWYRSLTLTYPYLYAYAAYPGHLYLALL